MEFLKAGFLASSATFAGFGTTISFVTAPAILGSADPLPSWRIMYNRGKPIAMSTTLITTGSGLLIFWQNGDHRFLLAATISFLVGPYTWTMMTSTNDAIFALSNTKDDTSTGKAKALISKWSNLQWIRTVLGVSAFAIAVHALVVRPQRFYQNLNVKLDRMLG